MATHIDDSVLAACVDRLRDAQLTQVPCRPVRDLLGSVDAAAAYRVQEHLMNEELSRGAKVSGWKIGLTSKAVQQQLGVSEPDFGVLLAHRGFRSGEEVPLKGLLQPRIEAEIGFVLGRDLPQENVSEAEVRSATESVVAVLEIPDSRIAGWDISIADTIADNASAGLYVVGDNPCSLEDVDLTTIGMTLRQGSEVVSSGTGAACMGDPVVAVTWLANMLGQLGHHLRAGDLILSGALSAMVPVTGPSEFVAEFDGLGSVATTFVAG